MHQELKSSEKQLPRLLTYQQLEQHYGIKVATAVSLVREGRIPCVRLGPRFVRFDVQEIERWIMRHRVTWVGGGEHVD